MIRLFHVFGRRSSVVERTLGKGEAGSSILPGGTIFRGGNFQIKLTPYPLRQIVCAQMIETSSDAAAQTAFLQAVPERLPED